MPIARGAESVGQSNLSHKDNTIRFYSSRGFAFAFVYRK